MNYLHLGDCLDVLRQNIKDESVDLIYIDPPFNSKRNYNIFFDDKDIKTQHVAFMDTWSLKNTQDSLLELQSFKTEKLYQLLMVYFEVAPFAFPYLVMMALRIVELHRVLKLTGSFYLHCDPTMSHYLKTICDLIFGEKNFRNEIVWHYRRYTATSSDFQRMHDVIFRYAKTSSFKFNILYQPYQDTNLKNHPWEKDKDGIFYWKRGKSIEPYKIYMNEKGTKMNDVWIVPQISPIGKERLGYPTQKPKALLERIIKASSNEGDVVLDSFCGCGTSVDMAEGLKRKWIGIDISPIATNLIKRRLKATYGKALSKYEVRGIPNDEQSAIKLWEQNPFAFQDWWITEHEAFSSTFGKKGSDKGIDGIAKYRVGNMGEIIKAGFQVKGGKVQSKDIDALWGAMNKHKCELGVFLSINTPTRPMLETIASSGYIEVPGFKFPKLQCLTLDDFFAHKKLKLPQENITFEPAILKGKGHKQMSLYK